MRTHPFADPCTHPHPSWPCPQPRHLSRPPCHGRGAHVTPIAVTPPPLRAFCTPMDPSTAMPPAPLAPSSTATPRLRLDLTSPSCLGLAPPASVAPEFPLSHMTPLAPALPLSLAQHPATCLNRRASLGLPTGNAAASAPGPRTTTCSCHAAAALSCRRRPVMPPPPCHAAAAAVYCPLPHSCPLPSVPGPIDASPPDMVRATRPLRAAHPRSALSCHPTSLCRHPLCAAAAAVYCPLPCSCPLPRVPGPINASPTDMVHATHPLRAAHLR